MTVSVEGVPMVTSVSAGEIAIPLRGTCLAVTVTEQFAVLPPSTVATVMVAEPAITAVTLPLPSTVAILEFEELHFTFLFVASAGDTLDVNVSESPSTRLKEVLLIDTPVTGTPLSAGCSSCPQLTRVADDNTTTTIAAATLEIVLFIYKTIYSRMTRLLLVMLFGV